MTVPISVIVTAYRRIDQTITTLGRILQCVPAPSEVIVHIDGNQSETLERLHSEFPQVRYLLSTENQGPGGGRNLLIKAATHELVASFDDDSFPLDFDYFARVIEISEREPGASIIVAAVVHADETIPESHDTGEWVSDFIGCGCIYRRSAFLETTGYVPLPTAYGMEEVDLALRLHSVGKRILKSHWLRVFHDTDLKRHSDPEITAGSITNIFLLSYLRYPPILWPIGLAQVTKRIFWLLTHQRQRGIIKGLLQVPTSLQRNQNQRKLVSGHSLRTYLSLRRRPTPWVWKRDGNRSVELNQGRKSRKKAG